MELFDEYQQEKRLTLIRQPQRGVTKTSLYWTKFQGKLPRLFQAFLMGVTHEAIFHLLPILGLFPRHYSTEYRENVVSRSKLWKNNAELLSVIEWNISVTL